MTTRRYCTNTGVLSYGWLSGPPPEAVCNAQNTHILPFRSVKTSELCGGSRRRVVGVSACQRSGSGPRPSAFCLRSRAPDATPRYRVQAGLLSRTCTDNRALSRYRPRVLLPSSSGQPLGHSPGLSPGWSLLQRHPLTLCCTPVLQYLRDVLKKKYFG